MNRNKVQFVNINWDVENVIYSDSIFNIAKKRRKPPHKFIKSSRIINVNVMNDSYFGDSAVNFHIFICNSQLVTMVAYFCHHLSDNYVDLSDLYVVLSDLYFDSSVLYVNLSLIHLLENES